MDVTKREKLVKKIETHLRKTSRELIKFDSEKETLQFLCDSFCSELSCYFVGIILKEGEDFVTKAWSGCLRSIPEALPLRVSRCDPHLLHKSMMFDGQQEQSNCDFSRLLWREKIPAWFTVPLIDEASSIGFCVIGYLHQVTLMGEMEKIFDEFGKDAAAAIDSSKQKERQKNKLLGMEWLQQNFTIDSSIEKMTEKLVKRAEREIKVERACLYFIDEKENCLLYQPSSSGRLTGKERIDLDNVYELQDYFPYLETPGGQQLTIPLQMNRKIIGVLHVESKPPKVFSKDDVQTLEFLAHHAAIMIENARLYQNEKEHKQRLHFLLDYQQSLVKETVEGNHFSGITNTLSSLFSTTVILLDRFMRPISYKLYQEEKEELHSLVELVTYKLIQKQPKWTSISSVQNDESNIAVWPINVGGDVLGYLAIEVADEEMDDYYRLSINLARNIYSIQFIKQKLVLDAKEQVKDSFINKLLAEKIEDEDRIIQYANLFNWDIFSPHRVAIVSFTILGEELSMDLLEREAYKSMLADQLREKIPHQFPEILITNKEGEWILIVPVTAEKNKPRLYWNQLYEFVKKEADGINGSCQIFIAAGGKTEKIADYYLSYLQAAKSLNVVKNSRNNLGYALFDELGAYTLLYQLKDTKMAEMFIQTHLAPLLHYSKEKKIDLSQTLRVYLEHNGSIKETAEELFIHRTSLLYRLEKIELLLNVDLSDSEQRFNLLMAFKLNDLYWEKHR
nr:helix-turn-helix domain-containing protein [uncultured Bacillus sp.]